jgi:hypothetical protein
MLLSSIAILEKSAFFVGEEERVRLKKQSDGARAMTL